MRFTRTQLNEEKAKAYVKGYYAMAEIRFYIKAAWYLSGLVVGAVVGWVIGATLG